MPPCDLVWQAHPRNPLFADGEDTTVETWRWNDPSVLDHGDALWMWLSGGDYTAQPITVTLHRGTSTDGLAWDLDPAPLLAPGPDDWDAERVETPSVVYARGAYHMYYSGCGRGCGEDTVYAIGHATSADGLTWVKDPANPVITAQDDLPEAWGYGGPGVAGVGEPAALYADGRFYLYYTGLKLEALDAQTHIGRIGILLATSEDGSSFTHHEDGQGRAAVLTYDIPDLGGGVGDGYWFGYTSPAALRTSDGRTHLFVNLIIRAPEGGSSQGQLDHAAGTTASELSVVEERVLEVGQGDWKNDDLHGPSALERGGALWVWVAGATASPYRSGVGLVTQVCE